MSAVGYTDYNINTELVHELSLRRQQISPMDRLTKPQAKKGTAAAKLYVMKTTGDLDCQMLMVISKACKPLTKIRPQSLQHMDIVHY